MSEVIAHCGQLGFNVLVVFVYTNVSSYYRNIIQSK